MHQKSKGLKKEERLRKKRWIDLLFKQGRVWKQGPLLLYTTSVPEEGPTQVLFAVPKHRCRQAVVRNQIKRRLREAYRQQKSLTHAIQKPGSRLLLAWIFRGSPEQNSYHLLKSTIAALLLQIGRS